VARSRLGRFGLGGVTALVASAALAACGSSSTGSSTPTGGSSKAPPKVSASEFVPVTVKDGGTLRFAQDQDVANFNQNTSAGNSADLGYMLEGVLPSAFITQPNLTVKMNSDLLTSATLTSSSPETVVYKINPKAVWSDGVPITADDFIYLWQHLNGTNPKYDVASTTGYSSIKSVTGSDGGKTVTTVYSTPFSDWRSLFASAGGNFLLPAHYMKTLPGDDVAQWSTALTSPKFITISGGPYIIQSYDQGKSLTEVPNPKWWGAKPHLDKITYEIITDSDTQVQALQNGDVDMIYPQPQLALVQKIQGISNVTSGTSFGLTFEHLDFNEKTPGLDDVKVRQAIAQATNIPQLLDATLKQFSPSSVPLGNRIWLNNQPQYVDNAGSYGKGDLTAEAALLTADGYTKDASGYYAKAGKELSFRFSTTSGNALRATQGTIFQAQMKTAGIKITIKNLAADDFFGTALPKGDFDIADFAWVGNPFAVSSNSGIYSTKTGDSSENYDSYSNPEVDKLFTTANSTFDETKVAAIGNQIDKILWQDMVTIPLYQKPTFIAVSKTYGNIVDNPSEDSPFWNVAQWGLK
jgi:peptide/nickel transport system substrate-binding protein